MREGAIVYEKGDYWVGVADRQYTVWKNGLTHSVADSSYTLDSDGLSLATARCDYLARNHDRQRL